MSFVQASPPYNTRSVHAQSDTARDVLSEKNMEDAVRSLGRMIASETHGHTFRSSLLFHRLKQISQEAKENVQDLE